MLKKIFAVLFTFSILISVGCSDSTEPIEEPISNVEVSEDTAAKNNDESDSDESEYSEISEIDVRATLEALSDGELKTQNTATPSNTYEEDVYEEEETQEIVYITRTGAKYHSAGCGYLSKSCIEINLSDAKSKGYTPCSKCW